MVVTLTPNWRRTITEASMCNAAIAMAQITMDESIFSRAVLALKPACFAWNTTCNTLKYNARLLELFGLPPTYILTIEEVLSLKFVLDKDAVLQEIFNMLSNAQLHKRGLDINFRITTIVGEIKWIRACASINTDSEPESDSQTQSSLIIGTLEDITAIREKFKAETETEQHLQPHHFIQVTETIPHLIWVAEPSGSVTYFNKQWSDYTGYKVSELNGWKWLTETKVMHPDDADRTGKSWIDAVATGQNYEIQYRLRNKDGMYRWHLGRAVPLKRVDGSIVRWFGSCTDIHEQKELEQKIQAAEIQMRLLISNFPVSLFTIDVDGNLTFANDNQRMKEHIPFLGSVPIGSNTFEKCKAYGCHNFEENCRKALKGETVLQDIDLASLHFAVQYSPLKNDQNHMTGAAIVMSDVTIQKQAEKLAVSEQSAIKVAQMKSEFLSTMSHEIRTPLNGIIGMSELLAETKLSEEQEKYLTIIQSSGSHLLTLINDILDYSKIDSGQLILEQRDFNLISLLENTTSLFGQKSRTKNVTVSLSVDQTLTDLTVTADEGRITQILINLVSNALKFTPANGSINVHVAPITKDEVAMLTEDKIATAQFLRTKLTNDTDSDQNILRARVTNSTAGPFVEEAIEKQEPLNVLFIVKDTGIGVSQEIEQRLFSPFFQALGTNRKFGGTGLGLSICKKLSELMKGEIGVVSREGDGSLFWFELPIRVNHSSNLLDHVESEIVPFPRNEIELTNSIDSLRNSMQDDEDSTRVLVVEDHPVNKKLMILTLQKLDCSVTAVNNGVEALDVLYKEQKRFDIIFMDCHMPLLDGYATSKAIREHERQAQNGAVPIIALTAAAMPGDREKCMEAGMNDYITKPVKRSLIESSLKKWTTHDADEG